MLYIVWIICFHSYICIHIYICIYIYIYIYCTSLLMHRDGSSMMFPLGSGGAGLATSDPLAQMTQLALILRQLPSRQLNFVSFTQDKWLQKWFYFWVSLLNFGNSQSEFDFFDDCWNFLLKLRGHFALVFPAGMTLLFSYLFNPVCSLFPNPKLRYSLQ